MGIDSRGSNAFMTKNLLKGSNIWAALHKGTQRTNDGMPVEEDVPTYKYFYVKQRNRRMQIELRIMFIRNQISFVVHSSTFHTCVTRSL